MRYEFGRIRAGFIRPGSDHASFPLFGAFHALSIRLRRCRPLFSAYHPEKHYMRGPSGKARADS